MDKKSEDKWGDDLAKRLLNFAARVIKLVSVLPNTEVGRGGILEVSCFDQVHLQVRIMRKHEVQSPEQILLISLVLF